MLGQIVDVQVEEIMSAFDLPIQQGLWMWMGRVICRNVSMENVGRDQC